MKHLAAAMAILLTFALHLLSPNAGAAQDFDFNLADPFGGGVQDDVAFGSDSSARVNIELIPASRKLLPGSEVPVAIVFEIARNWKIYAGEGNVPGEYYKTKVEVDPLSQGPLTAHPYFIQWGESKDVDFLGDMLPVYQGVHVVHLPVVVAQDAQPGVYELTIRLTYQSCDDMSCLAPVIGEEHTVVIEVVTADEMATLPQPSESYLRLFAGFDPNVWSQISEGRIPNVVEFDVFGLQFRLDAAGAGLFLLLLVAAVGGALLNFTPCVLPVIPIKIMSLSMHAGNRMRTLVLGTSMFFGVVAFWLGLGVVIASLAGFTSANQLFQYPAFTITVGVIIAVMAVAMCGFFTIRLPQKVYSLNPSQDSLHGSFLFGIMTAILSTPCTAPLMGAAAAWAATQPVYITMLTFASIGFGMGLPYMILSAFPKLVEKMPRTGPGSELIKQVMGLFMLAAAAYFIGVGFSGLLATPGEPVSLLYWWPVAGFVIAGGLWLAWRTVRITSTTGRRIGFGGIGLALAALAVYLGTVLTDKGPIDWVYFTPERFEQAKQEGRVVVMEFTAEWCINCKVLEQGVLFQRDVVDLFRDPNVVPMKVDLTGNNAAGAAKLQAVNRVMIPLLVVFSPDGSEVFKGDYYTVEQVINAVAAAQGGQSPVARGQ